jgi:hypothetical protein
MTNCPECGNELREGARFCDKCGFPVVNEKQGEDPFPRASDLQVKVDESSENEGNAESGHWSELLENPDLPALVDYRVVGFLLVAGLFIVLGLFSPPAPFHNDSFDYWPNMLYLFLGCVCLVFAFAYKKTKR